MMSLSLLLLLLLIEDFNIGSYAEFYFMKLNKSSEKQTFILNHKNKTVTDFLEKLTLYFVKYKFDAIEIREFIRDNMKSKDEKEFEKIVKKISYDFEDFLLPPSP